MKIGSRVVGSTVTSLRHRVGIDDLQPLAATTLSLNEIGVCDIALSESVAFDAYTDNRSTGSFILIDRFSNATVAAGTIQGELRPADQIQWQTVTVERDTRAQLKGQRPCVLWFTGLSGAGKSTIANLVESKLFLMGYHTYLLDGDNVRHGLSRDLGFTTPIAWKTFAEPPRLPNYSWTRA